MILGLSAKRGGGKDTLARFLSDGHGVEQLSLAKTLKERIGLDFGLTHQELNGSSKETPLPQYNGKTPRDIMIAYGQFFRSVDPDFWLKQLKLVEREKQYGMVSISDVRFKNEANYIRSLGGLIIRLERDPKLNIYGPALISDISETDLDDYDFDVVLPADKNVDLKDLENFADKLFYEGPSLEAKARARNSIGFRP